ncbi:MAG: MgtC/SapB family protein [Halieaceae bacterium]|jgi:uncharacterized membrane protein (DUF4010 family)|nr:MgtC/SapB family protein [Halieaceae bacterium]
MDGELTVYYQLASALVIGLLIGTERGWKKRGSTKGKRVAGVRTYGLIGLTGGVTGLLGEPGDGVFMGLSFVALSIVLASAYVTNLIRDDGDAGITSLVAGLLTFVLGALAARGEVAAAAAGAVVTTLLLDYKPVMHEWLHKLEGRELSAGIKLLLISVVLLPVLPNRGFGPWQVLNPFAIWWMVVLIAAISFAGYFALKVAGAQRGTVYTSIFGGLASSTALTLHFSRLARDNARLAPVLGTGILLACFTMVPRILVLTAVLNRELLPQMIVPALAMALTLLLPALWQLRARTQSAGAEDSPLRHPLELGTALGFGALLAIIMVLAKALQLQFGDAGIHALAAISGITDVDAITLSVARMSKADLAPHSAVVAILIAAAANNLAKAVLAVAIAGRGLVIRVGLPLAGSALAALVVVW